LTALSEKSRYRKSDRVQFPNYDYTAPEGNFIWGSARVSDESVSPEMFLLANRHTWADFIKQVEDETDVVFVILVTRKSTEILPFRDRGAQTKRAWQRSLARLAGSCCRC
jgi:hypothetical protein